MLKVLVFLVMAVGAFILAGMIATHAPSVQHTAVTIGQSAISWGTLILFGLLGFSGWVAAKA